MQSAAKTAKTAIVIIGRTAGEEQDNRMEPGSFLLTDEEKEMLRLTRAHFEKVVVLLNVGNISRVQAVRLIEEQEEKADRGHER